MIYYLITALCFTLLAIELALVIVSIIFKTREERISFVRSFKRGKCAVIYVTALPLYVMGGVYAGNSFFYSFFDSISKMINLVVLKFDIDKLPPLVNENSFYKFTLYFCFFLVTLNAILFSLSLIGQRLWNFLMRVKRALSKKELLYIFGNNPENVEIYESDGNKRAKAIVAKISPKEAEGLYSSKCSYLSFRNYTAAAEALTKHFKYGKRKVIFVVNTGSEECNIDIINVIQKELSSQGEARHEELFSRVRVFVFGDPSLENIYTDMVKRGFGTVHYINKYRKIAMDFIDRYPLARFLDGRHIDYKTSYIKDGVDINVILLGFGKTNKQIFLSSVANNQFIKGGKAGASLKPINYYIYDKNDTASDKNLNHTVFRYKREIVDFNKNDYLPLPDYPLTEHHVSTGIESAEFYDSVRQIINKSGAQKSFAIIAFGTDLENIDMAKKLCEKRSEWGLSDLVIFVKSRRLAKDTMMGDIPDCIFFGNEREAVYNIEKIVGDKIYKMAKLRNEVYDIEYEIKHGKRLPLDEDYLKELRDSSYRKWYTDRLELERESSLYCCLSLRSKLNMMGLDCVPKEENDGKRALTELEYLDIYAGEDKPKYDSSGLTADGKKIINYPLDIAASRRTDMAIHEHLRWNSYMISKGIMPASKEEIRNEKTVKKSGKEAYTNGKNYPKRRHGNLTTFAGLVAFRKIIAERDNIADESKCDVISYDYQLLDDAYWLLDRCGYKIVDIVENRK